MIIIPHLKIGQSKVSNISKLGLPIQIEFKIGFSYDNPPTLVKRALMEVCLTTPGVISDPEPEIRIVEYAASSIVYEIEYSIPLANISNKSMIMDQVNTKIWYAAKNYNLSLPYDQMVLHKAELQIDSYKLEQEKIVLANKKFLSLFGINIEDVQDVVSQNKLETIFKSTHVTKKGKPCNGLYYIIKGDVALYASENIEDDMQIAEIDDGDFFGEVSFFSNSLCSTTAVALTDLEVLFISSTTISVLSSKYSKLGFMIDEIMDNRRKTIAKLTSTKFTNNN